MFELEEFESNFFSVLFMKAASTQRMLPLLFRSWSQHFRRRSSSGGYGCSRHSHFQAASWLLKESGSFQKLLELLSCFEDICNLKNLSGVFVCQITRQIVLCKIPNIVLERV